MMLRDEAAIQNLGDKGLASGWRTPSTQPRMDRRQHARFKADLFAFALIRPADSRPIKIADRSMGQIACAVYRSNPLKLGRIQNISKGGLMFHYVDNGAHSVPPFLDVILADCGRYVANLEFKPIANHPLINLFPDNAVQLRQLQVKFKKLAVYRIAKFFHAVNLSTSCLEG